jgi:hypothetical protein
MFSYMAEKFLEKLDEVFHTPSIVNPTGYDNVDINLQNYFIRSAH